MLVILMKVIQPLDIILILVDACYQEVYEEKYYFQIYYIGGSLINDSHTLFFDVPMIATVKA